MTWDRRSLLIGATAGAAAVALPVRSQTPANRRPVPSQRRLISKSVEACISNAKRRIADPEIGALFENCFPNTLDTTVTLEFASHRPDTFIVTGDIDAMWLRDSSAQVWPYLAFARTDPVLRDMFRGLIGRQSRSILIDPYANAFMRDPSAHSNLSWAQSDLTQMKPGVAERKWEIDSLCYPIRLAHGYWSATGDTVPFDETWREAARLIVATLRVQQRLHADGPYHFQRSSEDPIDTLPAGGFGNPTHKIGLIHSGFRPSDDACTFPYLVPANHFAVVALRQLAEMGAALNLPFETRQDALALAEEVEAALWNHAIVTLPSGQRVWAYEIDGYGNTIFMDDANVPSLLALPYLGCCKTGDAIYQSTRSAVWSLQNPYYFEGPAAAGIGGPHVGRNMIWPISLIIRALTSDDDREVKQSLKILKAASQETGFIHEAFHVDDPSKFTRSWFAWANSLFGELILDVLARKPYLLA